MWYTGEDRYYVEGRQSMGYTQPGVAPLPRYADLAAREVEQDIAEALREEADLGAQVGVEYLRVRAREMARERVRAERARVSFREPPVYKDFAAMQAALRTEEADPLLIGGGLLGEGDMLTITGQAKQGKTTVAMNLVKCLTEGTPFLDHEAFAIEQSYSVAVLDGEMPPAMWMRRMSWMEPQRPDLFQLLPFRGFSLDLGSELGMDYAILRLKSFGAQVWIIDNYSKFSHSVEDNNDDVGVNRWHNNVQAVMEGCPDMLAVVVIHHAGHSGGRARGSSVFRDRPDVLWDMTKGDPPEFMVTGRHGRDFVVSTLWDENTNLLSYMHKDTNVGNPASQRDRSFREKVIALVAASPGITRNQIASKIGRRHIQEIYTTIQSLVDEGLLRVEEGKRRAIHVYQGDLATVEGDES